MATAKYFPPDEQHHSGFPAVQDRNGESHGRWNSAAHAVGHAVGSQKKGRVDKLRERRVRQTSMASPERRGSVNPPPPAGPPPPGQTQTQFRAQSQTNYESKQPSSGIQNKQQTQIHDEISTHKQQPPLPQPRRNSMTNQSTFEALVAASDFSVPYSIIPDLHVRFQELESSLASRGLVVPPSNLLRNIITSTNENGTTSIKFKRRQSDAGVRTTPAPPPYQELLQKKPANLPPPPNGLQRDPSARSLTKVRQRVEQVPPPPMLKNKARSSASFDPPAGLNRSGSSRSTLSSGANALIARGGGKSASAGSPAKFRDKLYGVLEARNRDNLLQYKHTVKDLNAKIQALESKLADKNETIHIQQRQLDEAEARANATEERLEQQLTEAIVTNEQLQALQSTVDLKEWEYKENSRRSRLRTDAAIDTLRSLVSNTPKPKLPDMLDVLKSRACSIVRAESADIYVLDRSKSELISYRARVKSSRPPPVGAGVWRGRYPMDIGIAATAVVENQVQVVSDVSRDTRFDSLVDGIGANGVRSLIACPVASAKANRVVGVLVVVNKQLTNREIQRGEGNLDAPVFATGDVAALHDVAMLASMVIDQLFDPHEFED